MSCAGVGACHTGGFTVTGDGADGPFLAEIQCGPGQLSMVDDARRLGWCAALRDPELREDRATHIALVWRHGVRRIADSAVRVWLAHVVDGQLALDIS